MNVQTAVVAMAEMPRLVSFGDLIFDTRQQKVSCKDMLVHLTGKEYRVLYFIVCRSSEGKIAGRDALLGHLYGNVQDGPAETILNVFVAKIRKKLENAGSTCRIPKYNHRGYEIFPAS